MSNPIIKTERLIIRTPQLGDETPLHESILRSLPELQQWMPWAKKPCFDITLTFIQTAVESWASGIHSDFPFIVVHKEDNTIICASGYNDISNPNVPFYEIGYWLDTQYTGQGLATELTLALSRFAFESLGARRLQICTQKENVKSIRVAEKCGFKLEAILHNHCIDCFTNQPADSLIYACFDMTNLPRTNHYEAIV